MNRPSAMLSVPRSVSAVATTLLCLAAAPAARPATPLRQRASLRAQARAFDRAHRFDARRDREGGAAVVALNPDQAMELRFSADGLEIADDPAAANQLGLRLSRAGAPGALVATTPVEPVALGSRVEYCRGGIVEWYRNADHGLEQGFTFEAPVPGAEELAVELEIASGGRAVLLPGDRDARLRDAAGRDRLAYRGLRAFDAQGRELEARLEAEGSRLRLVAGVVGAAYPVTLDPVLAPLEVRRLEAFQPNALSGDEFGAAVAASADGSTLVVGAPLADRDPAVGDGIDLGQVYVYRRSQVGLSWEIAARLDSTHASPGRRLGHGVAVSANGSTIAVGSPGAAAGAGAVTVYREPSGGWAGQRNPDQTLLASDGAPGADFGWSVALDGVLLAAGAPSATVSTLVGAGAGYVFEDPGGGFGQVAKLTASAPQAVALLGSAVAAGGGWVALGEPARDAGASADAGSVALYQRPGGGWVNAVPTQLLGGAPAAAELGRGLATDGSQLFAGLPGHSGSMGQAQVYQRSGSVWSLSATLTAGASGAAGDRFGASVASTGTTVAVGAPSFGAGDEGAAFVFERPQGGWAGTVAPKARLSAGEAGAELGGAVAISASWLAAGSAGSDAAALDAGAVDAFRRPASGWVNQSLEDALLTAFGFDASAAGDFGAAVAVDENTLVVGHPGDDHAGSDEGSAYVFLRSQAGDSWEIAARLVASPANPFANDERFGASVAVDGDVIVVGAPFYDLFAASSDEGTAFVFVKPLGGWSGTLSQDARLQAANPNPFNANEHVGISVAIEGDLIAVGADSYELAHAASDEGAVFVYQRPTAGWSGTRTEDARLTASLSNPFNGAEGLGHSVAIAGDLIVAGANLYDFVGPTSDEGAAFVYLRPPGGWSGNLTEAARLSASDPNPFNHFERFGHAVDASGDTVVVGAEGYDLVAANTDEGVAFVFVKPAGGWSGPLTENAQLRASVPNPFGTDEFFGSAVAIEGDRIVVGARSYDLSAGASSEGAVFVYEKPVAGWSGILGEDVQFTASNIALGDELGGALAHSGQTLVVGARFADPGGIANAGAAYVFTLPTLRTFTGVAEGGAVELTLSGVTLVVPTGPGMDAASVAAAVAAAIVADPMLSAAGITATANGGTLEINGELGFFLVDDPGLAARGPTAVPSLGAPGAVLAALLMLALGARPLGRRDRAPA